MSTMPSEKLPTAVDTLVRSRSSKKDTGHSPTSIKQKKTLSMSSNRKGSVRQMRKFSTVRYRTASDTDARSRFRSHRSSENYQPNIHKPNGDIDLNLSVENYYSFSDPFKKCQLHCPVAATV
ncbi:hypothetical protein WUBG_03075 [Wuchereria bancrofti]|uniref:Uncharacterized protein n=1 Tax=Wuchereria bancrofti TaxID=6293 RepID=J9FF81_WUCBA|nr:hypothetical protein WUBG_03075 [Wuchereria bancrofti]